LRIILHRRRLLVFLLLLVAGFSPLTGCGLGESLDDAVNADLPKYRRKSNYNPQDVSDFYGKFYRKVSRRAHFEEGTTEITAIDKLPKDPFGNVNWTASVVQGLIRPRGSLDPTVEDDLPMDLNIFIEAKTPLMANVVFPHVIHTYWLSCNNCHPKIFIPEAGANPISMKEIFKGKWCGRCHNKVAFPFWPRANCVRCHIVLKGQSLHEEHFK